MKIKKKKKKKKPLPPPPPTPPPPRLPKKEKIKLPKLNCELSFSLMGHLWELFRGLAVTSGRILDSYAVEEVGGAVAPWLVRSSPD